MRVTFEDHDGRGLFSIIKCIISTIMENPNEEIEDIKILNSKYSPKGTDAFSIYFESVGESNQETKNVFTNWHAKFPVNDWWYHLRHDANNVWNKYFKLKDWVLKEIEKKLDSLPEKLLAVHYRATDKVNEVTIHPSKVFIDFCNSIVSDTNIKGIYLSTDDFNALDDFRKNIKGEIYFQNSVRSEKKNALHLMQGIDPIILGKETFIDTLVMSEHKYLMSGISNMSDFVTIINPNIKHIYIR